MSYKSVQQETLLIVDDIPENISVLFEFLTHKGFKILVAQDGENALQKAEYAHPDLILLDIMMPGMNGFETCCLLKENPKTQQIPVILMTALTDIQDKLKGFKAGAIDYVTKPLQQEEVLARINTHLTLRKLQQKLQKQNEELEAFAHTVAHDLKNPLNAVLGFADLLTESSVNQLDAESLEYLEELTAAGHQMMKIINALLLLAGVSKQPIEMQPLNMTEILTEVQKRLAYLFKTSQAKIILPNQWPTALGYAPWIEEIWMNYLSNGLKYGGQPPRLELGATRIEEQIKFWVRDNGQGLSPEIQARLFTAFTRLNQRSIEGQGLGLSIVQRIAERLEGQVGVESQVGQGSLFYFTLPIA